MVGKVHRKVQHLKHGIPPEEMGGTELENRGRGTPGPSLNFYYSTKTWASPGPGIKQFLEYFKEEIKDQLKGKPPNKL